MSDVDIVAQSLREVVENYRRAERKYKSAISKVGLRLDRDKARYFVSKAPRLFLIYAAFVRALRSFPQFLSAETSVIIISIPRTWGLDDMNFVAEACFGDERSKLLNFNTFCHPSSKNKKGLWDFSPPAQLAYSKVMVFAIQGTELHPEFQAAADVVLEISPSPDEHLTALSKLMRAGSVTDDDKEFLRSQQLTTIDAVYRLGRAAAPAVERLRRLQQRTARSSKFLPISTFGEAAVWARHLKEDLSLWRTGKLSWTDVDKGVLVQGPPGTGKTSFAVSLAYFLGIPIVPASLARWQSNGHLGDLLRAMYDDFNKARASAPSILLIDELDAVGDRRKFSGDSAQYCTEVVNGLLEALDGTIGREGVLVIGASNYPERIDPAILRPGRLEKHIHLGIPNFSSRVEIIQFYLPEITADMVDVAASRLQGASGADIEYLARQARQNARVAGRPVEDTDLINVLPPSVPFSTDEFWRVCVHEAGHAAVASLLNVGAIEAVEVSDGRSTEGGKPREKYGRVVVSSPPKLLSTEKAMRDQIAVCLGGMIAEELYVGGKSTSSGGRDGDLSKATEFAIDMAASFGMGRLLNVMPGRDLDAVDPRLMEDLPWLHDEVNFLLRTEHERTTHLLKSHKPAILAVAQALKNEHRLMGSRLADLLTPLRPAAMLSEEVSNEPISTSRGSART